jgi:hypothetical protein
MVRACLLRPRKRVRSTTCQSATPITTHINVEVIILLRSIINLPVLTTDSERRDRVVREIYDTEKSYVASLELLVKVGAPLPLKPICRTRLVPTFIYFFYY